MIRPASFEPAAHGQHDAVEQQPDSAGASPEARRDSPSIRDNDSMAATPTEPPPQRPKLVVPGQLIILTVAFLWGTNPPALRYLYASDGPPSPAALAGVQATAAAALLLALNAVRGQMQRNNSGSGGAQGGGEAEGSRHGRAPAAQQQPGQQRRQRPEPGNADDPELAGLLDDDEVLRPAGSGGEASLRRRHSLSVERDGGGTNAGSGGGASLRGALNSSTDRLLLAGAEVGAWGFLANAATVSGFQNTAASRGAFLIRLSAILTPLVASLAGESVTLRIWVGCLSALCGGVLMSLSHSGTDTGSLLGGVAPGDALLVGAALLWSVQTVRLGRHAQKFEPLALAATSMAAMAVLSDLWLAADVAGTVAAGRPADSVWAGSRVPLNWAVMLWPALAPWGAGQVLQVAGQSRISSSQTQILMASDPLWATLISGLPFFASGEQDLGPGGWVGGACIIAGAVLAGTGGARGSDQSVHGEDD